MNHEPLSEEVLRAAKEGDTSARDALVDATRARLSDHVHTRLGSHLRGRVEVDDVLQETFAKAFDSLRAFQWRDENSFLRWLRGIASNEILRLAKRERRRSFIAVETDDVADRGVSPSRELRRKERSSRLDEAFDELSPEHREVIVLARLEGLPLAVVGERMGRTPNAVAQLLGRALTKLKELFGDTESLSLPVQELEPFDDTGKSDES